MRAIISLKTCLKTLKKRLKVSGMHVGVRTSPQPTFTYVLYFRAFAARFLMHLIYLLAQLALALVQLD